MELGEAQLQSFVQQMAQAVAAIIEFDVTVVGRQLTRLAGTGSYGSLVGQQVPASSAFAEAMRVGRPHLVVDPRRDPACQACEAGGSCSETCHAAYPLMLDSQPIGVLGLIGFTEEQRRRMADHGQDYLALVESIARMVESAARYASPVREPDAGSDRLMTLPGSQCGHSFSSILGESPAIVDAKKFALKVATSSSTVLLTGESGTGKELFARAIHANSGQKKGPFVAVNCAAIPDELLDSELFGYDEGAFTGARRGGKPGRFELADGGTLFLDEIADCSLRMQAKLLRAVDYGEIQRVGSVRTIRPDVRIIAATNKDIEALARRGEFREDLYFRISVIPIHIPALRQRQADIVPLFQHFLDDMSALSRQSRPTMSLAAAAALESYDWPGNVRELRHAAEFALHTCTTGAVEPCHLPRRVASGAARPSGCADPRTAGVVATACSDAAGIAGTMSSREWERAAIEQGLRRLGSTPRAKEILARQLGVGRSTIYRKIRKYVLE